MNESDFCCIKQVTKSVSITIPIKYITNEIAAVSEILEGWKRQYVPKLQGVLVNYRNIRLSARTVVVHSSRTAPKCIITATFDLFCPTVGEIVKGTINRISREHIGCLIEGTINVSIHRQKHPPPELSKFIKINHPILFEIESFFYDRQTIRVKGHISIECVELMKEVFPTALVPVNGFAVKDDSTLSDDLFSNTESAAEEAFSNLDNFVELTNNQESKVEETLTSTLESPKKKSKKRKQESESPAFEQVKKKPKLADPNLSDSSDDFTTPKLKVNESRETPNNKSLKRKRESEPSPTVDPIDKKLKSSDTTSDDSSSRDSSDDEDSISNLLTTKEQSPDKSKFKQATTPNQIKESVSDSQSSSSGNNSSDHEDEGVLSSNHVAIKQESPTKKHQTNKDKKKKKSSDKKGSKKKKNSKKKDKPKSKKKSKVSATGEILKKDKKKSKKDKKDKKKDKSKRSKSKPAKIKSEVD